MITCGTLFCVEKKKKTKTPEYVVPLHFLVPRLEILQQTCFEHFVEFVGEKSTKTPCLKMIFAVSGIPLSDL